MRKKGLAIFMIMVLVSQLWTVGVQAAPAPLPNGIQITVLDSSGSPIHETLVSIMMNASLVQNGEQWEMDGGYAPYSPASASDGPQTTDVHGKTAFTVDTEHSYVLQISKEGYLTKQTEIFLTTSVVERTVHMSATGDVQVISTDSPDNLFNTAPLMDGTGIDLGIISTASQLSAIEGENYYSAVLERADYDIGSDGLPYDLDYNISALNASSEMREAPGNYKLLVFYYRGEMVNDHMEYTLLGYSQKAITIESSDPGPGPGPGPGGPSLSGNLVFELRDSNGDLVKTYIIPYATHERVLAVAVDKLSTGKIVFPSTFEGKETPESDVVIKTVDAVRFFGHTQPLGQPADVNFETNPYFWVPDMININNFGGSLSGDAENGYELSFNSAFNRINMDLEIQDADPLTVTFYQPGYENIELNFELKGENAEGAMAPQSITKNMGLSNDQPMENIQVPVGALSGTIVATAEYGDLPGDEPVEMFFGGVWEYLADRSLFAKTEGTNVAGADIITLDYERYFGKVTLHLQYVVGNGLADAMITFYESDFVGLDVFAPHGVGEWYSGITNASNPEAFTPTGFIYFLNDTVFFRPSNVGRSFTIDGVKIKQGDLYVPAEATYNDMEGNWSVMLPDVTNEPVTNLQLSVSFADTGATEIPLQIRRVLFISATFDYDQAHKDAISSGQEILDYVYTGEDSITFVNVFAYYPMDPETPTFELDHKLLVIYYQNDRVLGSKQFDVASDGNERNQIAVLRLGGSMSAEYAQFASADRLAVFLIDKTGISTNLSSFGGATFGIGAGWGHLLPNHPDYGLGKDGMLYE